MRNGSTERRIVLIDEVNPLAQTVNCIDVRGGQFQIKYTVTPGGAFRVPVKGERWIIEQNGYTWQLESQVSGDEARFPLSDLQPGDNLVEANGVVHLAGDGVKINHQPLGVTTWDRFEIPPGGASLVNLSHAPVDIKTVQVYNNRRIVDPFYLTLTQDTLSGGSKIRFSEGILLVYYQYIPALKDSQS
jgi:hypothetical protein